MWEWSGTAVDEGDEAAAWFSKYLDTPVRLVRWVAAPAQAEMALVRRGKWVGDMHAADW